MSMTEERTSDEQDDGKTANPADKAPNTGRSAPAPAEGSDDAPGPVAGSPRG